MHTRDVRKIILAKNKKTIRKIRYKNFQKGAIIDKGAIYILVILTLLIFTGYLLVGGTIPTRIPGFNNNFVEILPPKAEPSKTSLQMMTFYGATQTPYPTPPPNQPLPTQSPYMPNMIDCTHPLTNNEEDEILWGYSLDSSPTSGNQWALKGFYTDEHTLVLGSGTVSPMNQQPADHVQNPNIGNAAVKDKDNLPFFPAVFLTDISQLGGDYSGDAQAGGQAFKPNDVYGSWKAAAATDPINTNGAPENNDYNLGAGADPWPPSNGPTTGSHDNSWTAEIIWKLTNLKAIDPVTKQYLALVTGHTYRAQMILHAGNTGNSTSQVCLTFKMP